MTDITNLFGLSELDHHELLALLTLKYQTCWRTSKDTIAFPAEHDFRIEIKISHGVIARVWRGEALTDSELRELLDQIDGDLKDDRITEFGSELLFAHLPIVGSYHFKSLPMEIVQPPPYAPRPPYLSADHPFVLVYPLKGCQTLALRFQRRRKNAIEWAWVLNAFLRGSIKYIGARPRHMWAIKSKDPNECFWAQESYIASGFNAFADALSEQGTPISVVSSAAYYGGSRAQAELPLDTFVLPDNIDSLLGAFLNLASTKRRRFLRSAAAIYTAQQLWEISMSGFFVACVQAIETLVDRVSSTPCPTCQKETGPGPTKRFRQFIQRYCSASDVDRAVVDNLYSVRSALAHGDHLFQLDEAPWSMNLGASVADHRELESSRAALTVAKDGLRNWLLAEADGANRRP